LCKFYTRKSKTKKCIFGTISRLVPINITMLTNNKEYDLINYKVHGCILYALPVNHFFFSANRLNPPFALSPPTGQLAHTHSIPPQPMIPYILDAPHHNSQYPPRPSASSCMHQDSTRWRVVEVQGVSAAVVHIERVPAARSCGSRRAHHRDALSYTALATSCL
jgi:hypothetical protein